MGRLAASLPFFLLLSALFPAPEARAGNEDLPAMGLVPSITTGG